VTSPVLQSPPRRHVGRATLDVSTRLLAGPSGEYALEPRVLGVLLQLLDADGAVVTRAHLFEAIWNGVPVGDDSINRAIFALRQAFRSTGSTAQIETIPRSGYRLSWPDLPEAGATADEPAGRSRRAVIAGLAASVIAGGAWIALHSLRRPPQAAALIERGDLARRDDLPDAAQQGVGFYREALKLVPDDPVVWGKLALAHAGVADYGDPESEARAIGDCTAAIRRALALDPRQPEALVADAILPPHYGAWWPAEQKLRHVLAVAPDNAPAREHLALLLMEVGRVREAAVIIDALVEEEPLAPAYRYRHVYQLWARGRLAEADRVADQSLQLWPRHSAVWLARFWTFALTGRAKAALAMLSDSIRPDVPPPMLDLLRLSAQALLTPNSADVAKAVAADMVAAKRSPFGVVNAVLTLPPLGQVGPALEIVRGYLLRSGAAIGALHRPAGEVAFNQQSRRKTMVLWMPSAARLRADPGFAEICTGSGLRDYWKQAGKMPDYLTSPTSA